MIEKIEFGKVINTRGLDGTIKVQTSSEKMSFKNLKNVYLDDTLFNVEKITHAGSFFYIHLKEITTVESAQKLKNKILYINRENIVLNKNEYLVCDMLGLDVVSDLDKYYGKIIDITNYGAQDVYTIKNGKEEHSFCLIDGIIIKVDFDANKVILNDKILNEVMLWE